jgi:hypothetical protein
MEGLTEKVETLEKRLDELGDVFDRPYQKISPANMASSATKCASRPRADGLIGWRKFSRASMKFQQN